MKSFAAQLLYCSPEQTIRNGWIKVSDEGIVTKIGSLDQCPSEPQSTVFLNGILLPFCPETQTFEAEGVKESLKRQFTAKKVAPATEEASIHLWLLSGEGLFEKRENANAQLNIQQIL